LAELVTKLARDLKHPGSDHFSSLHLGPIRERRRGRLQKWS